MPDDADRWIQQMRKGSTKLAILQLVASEDRYGYEIVAEIRERTKGALDLGEANVYPALHDLEEAGHVTSYWREVGNGTPARKYYRMTSRGRESRERMIAAWKTHSGAMRRLIADGD